MARFLIFFIVLLAALFGLELLPAIDRYFVVPWTNALAWVSAGLVKFFDGDAQAQGTILRSISNGFAVSIERGCNGVEATFVLAAAILAFPAPWRSKLIGLGIGVLAVQSLNIVRVVSLFYLGQWNFKVFEWAHLYVWQALIMVDVLVVWLLWVRSVPPLSPAMLPDDG